MKQGRAEEHRDNEWLTEGQRGHSGGNKARSVCGRTGEERLPRLISQGFRL